MDYRWIIMDYGVDSIPNVFFSASVASAKQVLGVQRFDPISTFGGAD